MPLRAGTTREAPAETSTTRRARAARSRRRARQLARRRAVALACLIGALVALAAGVHLLIAPARPPESPLAGRGTAAEAEAAVSKGIYVRPARLIIPKIGLNAAIEDVGLTADDAMAAPSGPDTVGWYELGPRPGNKGSAVMDGHSGYADGRAAAFDELPQLGKGDRLFVEDASGRLRLAVLT